MLPDSTLSSQVVFAPFLAPATTTKLVDYELGGVALSDPSGGLDVQLWTARYVGGQIVVYDAANNATPILTVAGVLKLSLAFDSNMKPTIAYETAAGGFLYWFDTFVNANVTTAFPDVRNPAVTLDERRQVLLNNADVIFAYQKVGGGLYYRQQRDRFATERLLQADTGAAQLLAVGMNRAYRLQFKLSGLVPQPVYVPPSVAAYWNPLDKSVNITLAEDDKLASASSGVWSAVRGITGRAAGKWYGEVQQVIDSWMEVSGVMTAVATLDGHVGQYGGGYGVQSNTGQVLPPGGATVTGPHPYVRVAYDADTGKLWVGSPSQWYGNGDPAAGTTPSYTLTPGTQLFMATSIYPGGLARLRTAATDMAGAIPAGFSPWG